MTSLKTDAGRSAIDGSGAPSTLKMIAEVPSVSADGRAGSGLQECVRPEDAVTYTALSRRYFNRALKSPRF